MSASVLWAQTGNGAVLRSTNGGATWQTVWTLAQQLPGLQAATSQGARAAEQPPPRDLPGRPDRTGTGDRDAKPTGRNILAAFQGLGLTYTHTGIQLDPLTNTQQHILELLGIQPRWPQQPDHALTNCGKWG